MWTQQNTLALLLTLGLHTLLVWLLTIPLRRMPADAHWTERARRYWPVRKALGGMLMMAMIFGIFFSKSEKDHDGGASGRFLAMFFATWATGIFATFLATRRLTVPSNSVRHWVSQILLQFNPLLSLAPFLFIGVGLTCARRLDGGTWAIFGGVIAWLLFLNFGGLLLLWRWLGQSEPAAPDLAQRLQALAPEAPPRVVIWKSEMGQALAFFWSNTIAFSQGSLAALDPAQIEAIARHELAHLREPVLVRALRLINLVSAGSAVLIFPITKSYDMTGLLIFLGIFVGLNKLLVRLARKMEVQADDAAAQSDPAVYAGALEQLYRINLMPGVVSRKANQIHPNLYDRMVSAGVTPDWVRPQPPSKWYKLVIIIELAIAIALSMWLPL